MSNKFVVILYTSLLFFSCENSKPSFVVVQSLSKRDKDIYREYVVIVNCPDDKNELRNLVYGYQNTHSLKFTKELEHQRIFLQEHPRYDVSDDVAKENKDYLSDNPLHPDMSDYLCIVYGYVTHSGKREISYHFYD